MRIALTFDDGPSGWTEQILNLLAEHNAKATFFVCGHAVDKHPDLVCRMVAEGHEIGNHSYDHPRMTNQDDLHARRQLERTQELILAASGYTPDIWRAPYFDTNERVNGIAEQAGLRHIGCTIDPADWRTDNADQIAKRVTGRLLDGAIVDLHDGIPPDGGSGTNTRQPTVDAVAKILQLDADFVTVTELERKVEPQDVAVVIPTRGDVDLTPVFAPLEEYGFATSYVWDNATEPEGDLAVYGRYAAIGKTTAPVILTVDDDVALTRNAIEGLLASYEPGTITANMPEEYRYRYPDSCLLGFGSIFDRGLAAQAFSFLPSLVTTDGWFFRTCDVVFSSLTPYKLIDKPFEYLPWTHAENRMFFQPGNGEERERMRELCRGARGVPA